MAAEEFLIPFQKLYLAVLLLIPARTPPLLIISLTAKSLHIKVH